MKILGVIFCFVNNHRCYEELSTSHGEDQSITPEGRSLLGLGFLNSFPCEELVGTDHSKP